jgi:hypothetical protein
MMVSLGAGGQKLPLAAQAPEPGSADTALITSVGKHLSTEQFQVIFTSVGTPRGNFRS